MSIVSIQLPEKRIDESNQDWCTRAANSIQPEILLKEILSGMDDIRKSRGPVWSQLSHLIGHGSGISSAIVRRFNEAVADKDDR